MPREFFAFISIISAVFFLTCVGVYSAERYGCKSIAREMNIEWQYNVWTSCMVRDLDGRWVLLSQIRNIR